MGALCSRETTAAPQKLNKYICQNDKRVFNVSFISCQDHRLCVYCSFQSVSKKCCIVCLRSLNLEELEQKLKIENTCFHCNRILLSIVKSPCKCLLCEECFSLSLTSDRCLVCKSFISTKVSVECLICTSKMMREEMLTLECEHFICKGCLLYYVESYMKEKIRELRNDKGIPCYLCSQIIGFYIIQSVLSKEKFDIYARNLIEANECPKCKLPYVTDEVKIRCSSCFYQFCDKCLRDLENCKCLDDEEIFGSDFSACPGCRCLYAKDLGCSHVKCLKKECAVEFCFQCSAFRSPTLAHGNHYHRPQCSFFSEYLNGDVFDQKCEKCNERGTLCERPKNLKVPRRISAGEV